MFRKVNNDCDKQHLQNHLDKFVKWSKKWQMLFNTGHRNLDANHKIGDAALGSTVKKDLGITISADMKVSE